MWRNIPIVALFFVAVAAVARSDDSDAVKIQRALAAGPTRIRAHAAVITYDSHGSVKVLRRGTNGFTCVAGTPGVIGDDSMCMDAQGAAWVRSLMTHAANPSNSAPGVVYLLAGATSWALRTRGRQTAKHYTTRHA